MTNLLELSAHGMDLDVSTSRVRLRFPQIAPMDIRVWLATCHRLYGSTNPLLPRLPYVLIGFKQRSNIERLSTPYISVNRPV